MSSAEFGNPLRKFKLVFLGEMCGMSNIAYHHARIASSHARSNLGPKSCRCSLLVAAVRRSCFPDLPEYPRAIGCELSWMGLVRVTFGWL